MTPAFLVRYEAIDATLRTSFDSIMDDLLTAMENEGTAVLMVDKMATGQAALLAVGPPLQLIQLMYASMEAFGEMNFTPQGVTLQ